MQGRPLWVKRSTSPVAATSRANRRQCVLHSLKAISPCVSALLVMAFSLSLEPLRPDITLPSNDLIVRADEVPEHRIAVDDGEERSMVVVLPEVH